MLIVCSLFPSPEHSRVTQCETRTTTYRPRCNSIIMGMLAPCFDMHNTPTGTPIRVSDPVFGKPYQNALHTKSADVFIRAHRRGVQPSITSRTRVLVMSTCSAEPKNSLVCRAFFYVLCAAYLPRSRDITLKHSITRE